MECEKQRVFACHVSKHGTDVQGALKSLSRLYHLSLIVASQDMNGRYSNLMEYNDDFLVHAFQILCPALTFDRGFIHQAYTDLRKRRGWTAPYEYGQLLPLLSLPPDRCDRDDFECYIKGFHERAGREFLDTLIGDPEKCGVLYRDVGQCNARFAERYMTTLRAVKLDAADGRAARM